MDIHPWSRPVRRALTATVAVAVLVLTGACSHVAGLYTIESKSDAQAAASSQKFDPAGYVNDAWDAKVLPRVESKAVDAATLLAAIKADPAAAGKQYGHQSGVGGPFSYLIKGTGTVTKVDPESATQPITVRLGGSKEDISIGTGQVIAGTALRDAVGFISFSDFANQLDYADVATQLNDRVRADVLQKLPATGKDLVGKKVTFSGAFSSLVPGTVMIVPVTLEVAS
jgi:predicted lipoprotein